LNFTPSDAEPAKLLVKSQRLFQKDILPGPVLDLASGSGRNGVFLAQKGLQVTCCDRSQQALQQAKELAARKGAAIQVWHVDLEREDVNPLPEDSYGAILVFRYLHRPLIPFIKKALRDSGLLLYETFTVEQRQFGKPQDPGFLLKPGELLRIFKDWEIVHYFEGIKENPTRAVAQLVARKPARAVTSRQ
jgi:SAM-dependent methyltransferase